MSEKYKWVFREKENEQALPDFFRKAGIPAGVAKIMQRRGVTSEAALHDFLYSTLEDLANPFLMKGMRETVDRLLAARAAGERVVIYGDYDVDGITSTSILYRFFRKIGIDAGFYIPGREGEGYGLNEGAVKKLIGEGYSLLITVDCGISSAALIDKMADGIDFLVTDHHLPPEILPTRAKAVVNPHQKDCTYPFEDYAGCGVAFTVCRALSKVLFGKDYREDTELVALGTIADMVSLKGENRIVVREGIKRFRTTGITGLSALLRAAGITGDGDREKKAITADQVSFGLAPRINAAGRIAHAKIGVELMTTESKEEAERLAEKLCNTNVERQAIEREIYKAAQERIAELGAEKDMALVIDGKDWNPGVIGIVASRVLEKLHRPVLVVTVKDGVGKGSCRSIPGFNIYEALKAQSDLLLQFGGHTMAAGFSISEENIPLFRKRMSEYAASRITEEDCVPQLEIEQFISLEEVTLDLIRSLALLEPCGCDNPKPLFASRGVIVESVRRMGAEDRHFKCLLSGSGISAEAVFWNPGETNPCRPGDEIAIAYEPEIHEWYGEHVQLIGRDVAESKPEENMKLDRDFLVEVFLELRGLLDGRSRSVAEVTEALAAHFRGRCPESKLKVSLIIFEEIGILSRYSRGGQDSFVYHVLRDKLDLNSSSVYCKYKKQG